MTQPSLHTTSVPVKTPEMLSEAALAHLLATRDAMRETIDLPLQHISILYDYFLTLTEAERAACAGESCSRDFLPAPMGWIGPCASLSGCRNSTELLSGLLMAKPSRYDRFQEPRFDIRENGRPAIGGKGIGPGAL